MPTIRIFTAVLLVCLFFGQQSGAQSLTFHLFERYLAALREQAGIPGLAGAIVQNGKIAWERGFGLADRDRSILVSPDTPFPVNDLSQTVAAALFLGLCIDRGEIGYDDRVQRLAPEFGDRTATFRQVLSHTGPTGGYRYDRDRFDGLTDAIEECSGRHYAVTVVQEVLDRFGMKWSVPGGEVNVGGSEVRQLISTSILRIYISILEQLAVPYLVGSNRRATRVSDYGLPKLSSAGGLVASVHDMARFDLALDDGAIASRRTLDEHAWVRQRSSQMGLGWFVQVHNERKVVWHFGTAPGGGYSSLLIKLPEQRITLILLANSDGLTAPFPLASGDVTVSPFARVFFSLLG